MSFISGGFLLFLPIITAAYWLCPARWRYVPLLAGSVLFYMGWSVPLTLLLLAVTLVNWVSCLILQRHRSKLLLALLVALCFLPLVVCKYAGFLAETSFALMGWPGQESLNALSRIVLPVGISFYTFQAVACVVDVYRGDLHAEVNPLRFLLFVCFFPQLVAGPIERGGDLLPQLRHPRAFDPEDMRAGLRLLLTGFFRKVCVADCLAVYADNVYSLSDPDGLAVALGTVCFSFQIYNDFAGYSEIALGSARLLGIRLTRNFCKPYLARSLQEFWHRWHITLSRWFRTYVYVPLGGSRKGKARAIVASTAVFLLSGLWHGANWTFVAWGALHALFYNAEGLLIKRKTAPRGMHAALSMSATFTLVCLSWVLFRAESMMHAVQLYGALFSPWEIHRGLTQTGLDASALLRIALLISLSMLVGRWGFASPAAQPRRQNRDIAIAALLTLLIALCWIAGLDNGIQNAFIYFQF